MKHIYTFLCLILFSGVVSADNVIVGAFGQKLGSEFDSSLQANYVRDDGDKLYEFEPTKPYPLLSVYFVAITPVTKLIKEIYAWGYIKNKSKCELERQVINRVLMDKYKTLLSGYIGHRESGDRHIIWGCVCSGSECERQRLYVRYVGEKLEKQVIEEKASLVDKSNF